MCQDTYPLLGNYTVYALNETDFFVCQRKTYINRRRHLRMLQKRFRSIVTQNKNLHNIRGNSADMEHICFSLPQTVPEKTFFFEARRTVRIWEFLKLV